MSETMILKKLNNIIRRSYCSQIPKLEHESYFSKTAKKRQPSPIRELAPFIREKDMISLAGGLPNPSTFPFKSFSFQVPSKQSIINNTNNQLETLSLDELELDMALQYGPSKGIPQLYEWMKIFHNNVHKIPYNNWDLCISTGSQDLMTRTFDSILDDGDTIIIEAPTYSGTLAYLKARDINIISINMDKHGMIADELEQVVCKMQTSSSNIKFPKMLYIIPIGQNPSGSSYSLERKQQIYEIACKYNLLLFEDDPYYFLDFEHMDYNKSSAVSFQSMDIESRVIRSDSFSKTLSAGIRLGYLTGHSSIIRNIELNMQATCLHSSSLTQMIVFKVLQYWNEQVFRKHLSNVCMFYYQRRNVFESILNKYLKNKCEWDIPNSGMFYWLNVLGIDDTELLIKQKARNAKVLLLPGKVFYVDERSVKCSFVRAAFSVASENDMEEGIKRFASILDNTNV